MEQKHESGLTSILRNSKQATNLADQEEKSYTFYLDIVLSEYVQLPKVELFIPLGFEVNKAVRKAVEALSLELKPEGVVMSIDPNDYVPRLSKRSGKCSMDTPALDRTQLLSEVNITTMSLQVIKKDTVYIDPFKPRKSSLSDQQTPSEILFRKKDQKETAESQTCQPKPQSTCFSFC